MEYEPNNNNFNYIYIFIVNKVNYFFKFTISKVKTSLFQNKFFRICTFFLFEVKEFLLFFVQR